MRSAILLLILTLFIVTVFSHSVGDVADGSVVLSKEEILTLTMGRRQKDLDHDKQIKELRMELSNVISDNLELKRHIKQLKIQEKRESTKADTTLLLHTQTDYLQKEFQFMKHVILRLKDEFSEHQETIQKQNAEILAIRNNISNYDNVTKQLQMALLHGFQTHVAPCNCSMGYQNNLQANEIFRNVSYMKNQMANIEKHFNGNQTQFASEIHKVEHMVAEINGSISNLKKYDILLRNITNLSSSHEKCNSSNGVSSRTLYNRNGTGGCRNDWLPFEDKCYMFSQDRKNQFNAELYRRSLGCHLAELHDAKINTFVKNHLPAIHPSHVTYILLYWIGLTNEAKSKSWRWSSTGRLLNFTDWSPSHPVQERHCAALHESIGYRWVSFPCASPIRFVCEDVRDHHLSN